MKKVLIILANYYEDVSISLLNSAKSVLSKNYSYKVIKVPAVSL